MCELRSSRPKYKAVYFSTARERTTMLQQRRIEILNHKFPEISNPSYTTIDDWLFYS